MMAKLDHRNIHLAPPPARGMTRVLADLVEEDKLQDLDLLPGASMMEMWTNAWHFPSTCFGHSGKALHTPGSGPSCRQSGRKVLRWDFLPYS